MKSRMLIYTLWLLFSCLIVKLSYCRYVSFYCVHSDVFRPATRPGRIIPGPLIPREQTAHIKPFLISHSQPPTPQGKNFGSSQTSLDSPSKKELEVCIKFSFITVDRYCNLQTQFLLIEVFISADLKLLFSCINCTLSNVNK